MADSLQNLQFYKSFRMKTKEKDKIFIRISPLEGEHFGQVFEQNISLIDLNLNSLTFIAPNLFRNGEKINITIYTKKFFNKWELEVSGTIVRSFMNDCGRGLINYGTKLDFQDTESELKYFLTDFIHGFSTKRLKNYLIESALREKQTNAIDGVEFYSLLSNLFFDTCNSSIAEVLEHTTSYLRASQCKLYMINVDNDKLETVYNTISEDKESIDFREGHIGGVFTSGHLINIDYTNRIGQDKRNIDQVLAAPIYNQERKVIGVIEFINKEEGRFTFKDEKAVRFIRKVLTQFFEGFSPISKSSQVASFNPTLQEGFMYLGQSDSAVRVRRLLAKLKNTKENLHIVGESGLGKNFIASNLHEHGRNAKHSYIKINCKDEEYIQQLIDNSFTDLELEKPGTVYLENCGELKLIHQQLLKDYLSHSKKRIISSSLYDLESLIKKGVFLNDFYVLLSPTYIHLKPLRNRKDEILDIARYFLAIECEKRGLEKKFFSSDAVQKMLNYQWPNNTDELEKVIKKSLMKQSSEPLIDVDIQVQPKAMQIEDKTEMFKMIGSLVTSSDFSIGLDQHESMLRKLHNRGKKAS